MAQDPANPDLTDDRLARLRPASEILPPAQYEALSRREPLAAVGSLVSMTLRVDPDALAAFRATGPGWQARMNDVLKRAAKDLKNAS
ncbi:BrnA antitoxin family protein [Methylobacterium sp. JK268]